MASHSHDLYRALLRPFVIHTLRAAGYHGTRPSVLDTLVNITERYLILLASTTAKHALNGHNDSIPTVNDVRMALQECGAIIPLESSAEEAWAETLRRPIEEYGEMDGGARRAQAVKRKREEEDVREIRQFLRWFDGAQHTEIKRIAGMVSEAGSAVVGVGGGVAKEEDFLEKIKKRGHKGGPADDSRLLGTVLGGEAEGRTVLIEGGTVHHLGEWRPSKTQKMSGNKDHDTEVVQREVPGNEDMKMT